MLPEQQRKGLFDLPAEIRNQILAQSTAITDNETGEPKPIALRSLLVAHTRIMNNMLVSKQFLAESSPLFWGNNIIRIEQSTERAVGNTGNLLPTERAVGNPAYPERHEVTSDENGLVTSGKVEFFRGVAVSNSLQIKVFGACLATDAPKRLWEYALLLPPKKYWDMMKNIQIEIPVTRSSRALVGDNVEHGCGWLWTIRHLGDTGFHDLELVTFKFIGEISDAQKQLIEAYVAASNIDAKTVKVVFEDAVVNGGRNW
ncbi:Hypothetical predicted protein [Lecanosticta acicola]|uniref:Uncharacterized protein n=1 Tax=Lecanosticta acicola TaxID=111012 RepID=A0AAI8YYH8_9PEZI|nr:Hypothetical predicted protein [Lecanosticta acicola]